MAEAQVNYRFDAQTGGLTAGLNSARQGLQGLNQEAQRSGNALTTVGSSLSNAGEKISGVGKNLAGFSVASGLAVNEFLKFETGMNKLSTIADPTEKSMSTLKKEIMSLSKETGIGAKDIAEATYEAISSGVKTADAVSFVGKATKLASAGFTTSAKSVDILTTILNSYGMKASETTKISDILLNVQDKGKVTVDEMASSMGKLIPIASANGVGMEQLGAAYAIMTAKGVNAAETTTQVKAMFGELSKSGSVADKALRQVAGKGFKELTKEGKSVGDILGMMDEGAQKNGKSLTDMFGSIEAGSAALLLSKDGGKEFNAMLEEMNNSGGKTEANYKKVMQGLGKQLEMFANDIRNFAIEGVGQIAPVFTKVLEIVRKFVEFLRPIAPAIVLVVVALGLLGVGALALGGILSAVGSALGGIGSIIGFLASPIGLAIIVIVALVLAFKNLYDSSATVREGVQTALTGIGTAFTNLKTLADAFVNGFKTKFNELANNGVFEPIKQALTDLSTTITTVLESFSSSSGSLQPLISMFGQLGNTVAGVVVPILVALGTFLISLVDNFIQLGAAIIGGVMPGITAFATGFVALILPAVQRFGEFISGTLLPVLTNIADTFTNVATTVIGFLAPAFELVAGIVGGAIATGFNVLVTILTGLWTIILQVVDVVLLFVNGLVSMVTTAVSSFMNIQIAGTSMGTILSTGFELIKTVAMAVFMGIQSFVSSAMEVIKTVVTVVLDAIKAAWTFLGPVVSAVWNVIMAVVQAVINVIVAVVSAAIAVIIGIWNTIKPIVQLVWEGIKVVVMAVMLAVGAAVKAGIAIVNAIWKTIEPVVKPVWNAIKAIVETVMNHIKGKVKPIIDDIKSAFSAMGKIGKAAFEGIKSAVSGLMGFIDKVKDKINSLKDGLANVGNKIKGALGFGYEDAQVNVLKQIYATPSEIGSNGQITNNKTTVFNVTQATELTSSSIHALRRRSELA